MTTPPDSRRPPSHGGRTGAAGEALGGEGGGRTLVLASSSRYRARLLAEAGFPFETRSPGIDERAFDRLVAEQGVEAYVLALAAAKAAAVLRQAETVGPPLGPGRVVLAADQALVIAGPSGPRLLHQTGDAERALAQLRSMSGTTHELVNGIVVVVADADADAAPGAQVVDRHVITMRSFTEVEARAYVERFEPFDCVGSYRIEDDADLVAEVVSADPTGIVGLPMSVVVPLLARFGVTPRG